MKKKGMVGLVKHGIATALLIGVAALGGLATVNEASAQESLKSQQLVNTAIATAYNVIGTGAVSGISGVTLTNAQSAYSGSTGVPFSLGFAQNVPVWWEVAAYSANTGTSNLVLGLDLSPDGVYWTSNTVTVTLALTGTSTNFINSFYLLQNPTTGGYGTNVFSGYSQARWSYAQTAQLTNVIVLQNRLQTYR